MLSEDTLTASGELPLLRELMEQVKALELEAREAADRAQAAAKQCEELVDGKVTTFLIHRYQELETGTQGGA